MAKAEGFIDNYRILISLSSHPIGTIYLAEHTFREGPAVLLLLWTTVELSSSEDCQTFKQKADVSFVQLGLQKLLIEDAGVDNQHPYIVVTPYTANAEKALQEHLSFMRQVFQSTEELYPHNPRMYINVFLHIFLNNDTRSAGQLENWREPAPVSLSSATTRRTGPLPISFSSAAGMCPGLPGRPRAGRRYPMNMHEYMDGAAIQTPLRFRASLAYRSTRPGFLLIRSVFPK